MTSLTWLHDFLRKYFLVHEGMKLNFGRTRFGKRTGCNLQTKQFTKHGF